MYEENQISLSLYNRLVVESVWADLLSKAVEDNSHQTIEFIKFFFDKIGMYPTCIPPNDKRQVLIREHELVGLFEKRKMFDYLFNSISSNYEGLSEKLVQIKEWQRYIMSPLDFYRTTTKREQSTKFKCNNKDDFRMKIKNLRESKKLTQEELASKMNVERSIVAMWETGKAVPRCEKLPQLAEVLGCSVDDLFKR